MYLYHGVMLVTWLLWGTIDTVIDTLV